MENVTPTTKNVTLSFKTTADEKTALQQIANERNISRSELIASIVHAYKDSYDFIGKMSPKEEQLKLKLQTVEKQNRKLNLSLENAEHRIEIEQKANRQHITDQLKMNKSIFELKEKLKIANLETNKLMETLKNKEFEEQENYDPRLFYGSIGSLILSGIALFLAPQVLFNE